jgi:hypothetical protein
MNNKYGYNTPALGTDYSQGSALLYGSGLDEGSQALGDISTTPKNPAGYQDLAKGGMSAMNAGSSAGGALTSAGMYGLMSDSAAASAAGPYALGAGLALSAYEQSQKAQAAQEQARVQEANQRKQDVQMALNSALGATRQLGV